MKKVSLLIGTLGGAMAGYLFSNKKLREELTNAKDAETAAKSLAKHLQRDGKKLATEMQKFIESEEFQSNVGKAKTFALQKGEQAKKELQRLVDTGQKKARQQVKKTSKKVVRRMKMKTRKIS